MQSTYCIYNNSLQEMGYDKYNRQTTLKVYLLDESGHAKVTLTMKKVAKVTKREITGCDYKRTGTFWGKSFRLEVIILNGITGLLQLKLQASALVHRSPKPAINGVEIQDIADSETSSKLLEKTQQVR